MISENAICPTCSSEVPADISTCPHDGTRIPAAANAVRAQASLPDSILKDPAFQGKYEFLGVIGSGGMGVIYKARQVMLNKFVAIKMVHSHLVQPTVYKRFEIEARAAGKLSHPNIVGVHDYGMTKSGQPYMVMDYIAGKTLAEVLQEQGPISEIRFHRIFKQISDALRLAHEQHILHRDIKPSNIMLVKNDKGLEDALVMDFGIAKILHDDPDSSAQFATKTGETLGSPPYMSPEQSMGRGTDARSDLYSLGCLMYEALSGAPPFTGITALDTMAKHISDPPVPLSKQPACNTIDPQLEHLVMRLLEKNPDARYQSVQNVLADLQTVSKGGKLIHEVPPKKVVPGWQPIALAASALIIPIIVYCVWANFSTTETPQVAPVSHALPARTENKTTGSNPNSGTSGSSDPDELDMSKLLMGAPAKVYVEGLIKERRRINFSDVGEMYTVTRADLEPLTTPAASYVDWLKLRALHLTDNDIEPIKACKLEYLNLDKNKVQKLGALRGMNTLRTLSLSETNVDHDGLVVLSELTNLTRLWLDSNTLRDQDLPLLYGLKNLRQLNVSNNPFLTAKAVRELQKHLPPTCKLESEYITQPDAATSN